MTPNPSLQRRSLYLPDEAATSRLGAALAESIAALFLRSGRAAVVYFSGDLGTGKTTLIRALLRALGVAGRIKSPTYALVEPYRIALQNWPKPQSELEFDKNLCLYLQLQCYHFDFYRFRGTREWLEAGFREYFDNRSLCLVEWPENAGDVLPCPDLHVHIFSASEGEGRTIALDAFSEPGIECLNAAASSQTA